MDNRILQSLDIKSGFVNKVPVKVMRDTGCTTVFVRADLVHDNQWTGKKRKFFMINNSYDFAPVAVVDVDCPWYKGKVEALCPSSLICDMILGQIQGCSLGAAVETRSMKVKAERLPKPLIVSQGLSQFNVSSKQFKEEQKSDKSLANAWKMAESGKVSNLGRGTCSHVVSNGLLYRIFQSPAVENGDTFKQLMIPKSFRESVLNIAHSSVLGGHLGTDNTRKKIISSFFWPGILGDIVRYCRSCEQCQRTLSKGLVRKAPLEHFPLIEIPFLRCAVDIIGPINPASEKGNRYILTCVDFATRYPEAVPLRNIDNVSVAEALVGIFCRVGVPKEVLSDNGSSFKSEMMTEVSRLLSLRQLFSSPYHSMGNSVCERFNGTLRRMLRKMCMDKPRQWDRYIEPLLFAYRETPQASTKFSPFELLYGRTVRGPMSILRELWTNEQFDEEVKTSYEYVLDLRNRIADTCEIARQELSKSQAIHKEHFDKSAKPRSLEVGHKVLLLLPLESNKLLLQWKGPFQVLERKGLNDYAIDFNGKRKVFHINMLKRFYSREEEQYTFDVGSVVAAISEDTEGSDNPLDDAEIWESPTSKEESYLNVNVSEHLSVDQKQELWDLLEKYRQIFSSKPGHSNMWTCKVVLESDKPVRAKQYPIPHALRDECRSEIEEMLQLGVVEPSSSSYRAPIVLIRKKDHKLRLCTDFRALNKVTRFDAEPMPNTEEIFAKLAGCKFLSKMDFSKGYYQIPLSPESKEKLAFYSPIGLLQYRVMPFGYVNSGSEFNKMMRKLLFGIHNVDSFVDDVLTHTTDWKGQLATLEAVFRKIKEAGLTVKPSKCFFGYPQLEFIGHKVGEGTIATQEDKVEKIRNAVLPSTKKQLQSFLGLTGYYRQFCPSYSSIAIPLTDLTKSKMPNKINWTPQAIAAFIELKSKLVHSPILKLPEVEKGFVLRTDASGYGLGAVLLQEQDGILLPVSYASKKVIT